MRAQALLILLTGVVGCGEMADSAPYDAQVSERASIADAAPTTDVPRAPSDAQSRSDTTAPADVHPMCELYAIQCNGVCVSAVHACGTCGNDCCPSVVLAHDDAGNSNPLHVSGCGCVESRTGLSCLPIGCTEGFGNCDGRRENGCETNFLTDPENCGGCGVPGTSTHRCQGFSLGMCSRGRCI